MSDIMTEQEARLMWKEAVVELQTGRITAAIDRLKRLYENKHMLLPNLRMDISYTYGVSLLSKPSITFNPQLACKVLRHLIDQNGYGAELFNKGQTHCELGAALIELQDYQGAKSELTKGIIDLEMMNLPTTTHRIQLAIVYRFLRSMDECVEHMHRALAEAKQNHDYNNYGVACEQLGRAFLAADRIPEAHLWLILARWFHTRFAPNYLYTIADICEKIGGVFSNTLPDPMPEPWTNEWKHEVETAAAFARNARLGVLDIDLFQMLKASQKPQEQYQVSIPLYFSDEAGIRLLRELVSELQATWLHPDHISVLSDSFLAKHWGSSSDHLPSSLPLTNADILDKRLENPINGPLFMWWEAPNAWPLAFDVQLIELARTYAAARLNATKQAEKHKDIERFEQVPIFGRNLPRRLLARWWDLGETASGHLAASGNLLAALVQPSLGNAQVNRQKLMTMGYSDQEAKALDEGGIVGIPFFEVRNWVNNLGGLPVNEINAANPPYDPGPPSAEQLRAGYIVDTAYQTVFVARKLGNQALYGRTHHLYRDHFESFNRAIKPVGSLRLKHYSAPIVEVGSEEELEQMVKMLQNSEGCQEVYFRGQPCNWPLRRTPLVQSLLHGTVGLDEPSLPGAANRRKHHYETSHSVLSLLTQDLVYKSAIDRGHSLDKMYERWRKLRLAPQWEWDIAIMALAQHYGIPTDGIDITTNLKVALWFAVHDWIDLGDGKATYRAKSQSSWPQNATKWPVIYLIAPVTNSLKPSVRSIERLDRLGLEMTRPMRQEAKFFMGAHGHNRNKLAEAVAAVVRLKPHDWETNLTYEWLFPSPKEDIAYRHLLEAKHRSKSEPIRQILGHLVEYQ